MFFEFETGYSIQVFGMYENWWRDEAGLGTWSAALAIIIGSVLVGLIWSNKTSSNERAARGFRSFNEEVRRVDKAVSCTNLGIVPPIGGSGRLYGCIMGFAQTAKFFINESEANDNTVQDIKVMWNDWWKDSGYGQHADEAEAFMMVGALARLYAPNLMPELLDAFRGRNNQVFHSGAFRIEYRFTPGRAINERLLIVTEQQKQRQ